MSEPYLIPVGNSHWTVRVRPDQILSLPRIPHPGTPGEQLRAALEQPVGFEPLRRAMTPDDHIAVVVDDKLPHLAELLTALIEHLVSANIKPEAITLLLQPGAKRQGFIDELPDEYADVRVETHDPANEKRHAYLATTKTGRRVYLNRTLMEADYSVYLIPVGSQLPFPALSNDATRAEATAMADVEEIRWLLGAPFLAQVIEGAGDDIHAIVGGLNDSRTAADTALAERWHANAVETADLVIASISGDKDRIDFADLAAAAKCGASVLNPGGRLVILTDAAPELGEAEQMLRAHDDPAEAKKTVSKGKLESHRPAARWAAAAAKGTLTLASGYEDDVAEELFALPIHKPSELQRLIDAAESVLVIPDAHKTSLTPAE
jgi:nickel-dependent lactate racemase